MNLKFNYIKDMAEESWEAGTFFDLDEFIDCGDSDGFKLNTEDYDLYIELYEDQRAEQYDESCNRRFSKRLHESDSLDNHEIFQNAVQEIADTLKDLSILHRGTEIDSMIKEILSAYTSDRVDEDTILELDDLASTLSEQDFEDEAEIIWDAISLARQVM